MQYQTLFSLFDMFSHLGNLKKCIQRRITIPQGQKHVSSVQQSLALFVAVSTCSWIGDETQIPRVVITFFYLFFSS